MVRKIKYPSQESHGPMDDWLAKWEKEKKESADSPKKDNTEEPSVASKRKDCAEKRLACAEAARRIRGISRG